MEATSRMSPFLTSSEVEYSTLPRTSSCNTQSWLSSAAPMTFWTSTTERTMCMSSPNSPHEGLRMHGYSAPPSCVKCFGRCSAKPRRLANSPKLCLFVSCATTPGVDVRILQPMARKSPCSSAIRTAHSSRAGSNQQRPVNGGRGGGSPGCQSRLLRAPQPISRTAWSQSTLGTSWKRSSTASSACGLPWTLCSARARKARPLLDGGGLFARARLWSSRAPSLIIPPQSIMLKSLRAPGCGSRPGNATPLRRWQFPPRGCHALPQHDCCQASPRGWAGCAPPKAARPPGRGSRSQLGRGSRRVGTAAATWGGIGTPRGGSGAPSAP
mmetsp:Transcript_144224/g.401896  ORF Transcript_144224/g.401896 Transcript_144224/m.401896 type:complete len:326 (+) Transcript_144224:286-1263(+)